MMLPPVPCLYICRSAARVVRKAPSRWMASIFFHLANSNSSIGATIWMPALLTRMSTRPKASTALAMPASTCVLVGHVHGDADGAPLAAELGRGGVGAFLVEVGDGDLGALAHEDAGDLLADAARGAGDDGDLVLETHDCPRRLGVQRR